MRPNLLVLTVVLAGCVAGVASTAAADPNVQAPTGLDRASCTFDGHPLYGKIEIVDAFADVKVQLVHAFPDLQVEKVTAFPDACGKWQLVDAFPDTKVELVTAFPDVTIEFVGAFPGIR